jgi:hypothetical protein
VSDEETFEDIISGENDIMPDLTGQDMVPLLRNQLAWDIAPCDVVKSLWEKLALSPQTEEGAEIMHRASHARLNLTMPLHDVLEVFSVLTADMVARIHLSGFESANPDAPQGSGDYARFQLTQQYTDVVRSALFPVLGHLIENHLLTYGPACEVGTAEEVQE